MDENERHGAAPSSFMLFMLGSICFAMPTESILRVVGSQPLMGLPHLPTFLMGVVAIAGKVVPVLDLRRLLDLPEETEAAELLLIAVGADHYAMRVDRILRIANASFDELQAADEQICGIDIAALIAAHVRDVPRGPALSAATLAAAPSAASGALRAEQRSRYLAVETASGQEFLLLDQVAELCETLAIVALPDPSGLFMGGAFYRGVLLPALALDILLGRPAGDAAPGGFVMVNVEGRRCALAVKRVIGMVPDTQDHLDLRTPLVALLPQNNDQGLAAQVSAQALRTDDTDYLLATIGTRICAFALASVAHLHESNLISRVPRGAGEAVMGATAIGGRVVPVLDLASQIGLPKPAAESPMIEFKSAGGTFVVLVDRILRIASIAPEALMASPENMMVQAVVRRDDDLLWIIDAAAVVEMRQSSYAA
ncbi:MAG: chemotaxis protein CheW [Methylovirgula sp.]